MNQNTPDQVQTYPIVEIFESLQGEGANTGKPVVFLRFGTCNLACPWCDTDFSHYEHLDEATVMARVRALGPQALIVTGGEPLIQPELGGLLRRFKGLGYWIGIETNGVQRPPQAWRESIDYLAVSPKALYAALYDDEQMVRRADEVRIVVDGDNQVFCRDMRNRIEAAHYFLSPCERDGVYNIKETLRLLGVLNQGRSGGNWLLSLQTHKLAGIS